MDVNSILSKILNEQEVGRTAKGINYQDTNLALSNAKTKCPTLKFLGAIKQMTPSFPMDENNVPLMNKFVEIYNMKPESVAFASGKNGNENIVVFGVVDPNTQSGERGLLAYTVSSGKKSQRLPGGAGTGCGELQRFEDFGQAKLSEMNQAVLQSFINRYGSMYTVSDKSNMQNFKKVALRDLRHNGQPLEWDGDPQGFVWQKIEGGSTKFSDNPEVIDKKMKAQGFTDDQTQIEGNDALLELGFYLKDVMKDLSSFQIDPNMVTNKPYWPTEDGGVVIDPTPSQCREFVRTLKDCRSNRFGITSSECLQGLFQRKLSTIRCNKKGMFNAGGVLGLKDDFESLMGDTGKYGLANLASGLGKVRMGKITAESTLEFKINNLLNEEHRKFSFNEVKKHQYNFNKELVEDFSSQLVLSAYFDLQKSMKRLKGLNEGVIGDIKGGLGFNLGDKLLGGAKETTITYIIQKLGFKTDSFFTLLLINVFANLDVADYKEFFTNCAKFTKIIVKSALEAWLDMAMKKIGGGAMEGIVYSALKNTVTETAAQTTVFKRLEKLADSMVCPIVQNIDELGGSLI